MKLTDIDLKGYGHFADTPGAFTCSRYHLPQKWAYIFATEKALLRLHQDGSGYLQADPPGGMELFKQERGQSLPNVFTWIRTEHDGKLEAFSNFWLPTIPLQRPGAEPDEYECAYTPEAARYRLRYHDWTVETEYWTPPRDAAAIMTVTLRNDAPEARAATLFPVIKPYLAARSLAPWDTPYIYQFTGFCRLDGISTFWIELRNPGGDPAKRVRAAVVSDLAPDGFEVSADRFTGKGDWASPEAIWDGHLALTPTADLPAYGTITPENGVIAQPPLAAMEKAVTLAPGEAFSFTVVFGALPATRDGHLPPAAEVLALAEYLDADTRAHALAQLRAHTEKTLAVRAITTPDESLNRYINEYLPLQLAWVSQLDRGWPSGMRGTRDAAQDATGIVAVDPAIARRRLLEIFACQRSDGWFLRQFSVEGRHGKHDWSEYVDSGCWVWELLWEYLCYTRDFAVLDLPVGWLDRDDTSSLFDHAQKLFEYYLDPENIGEHGLCKIRHGDWNDSINRAGVEGRGETTMVTCQVVSALTDASALWDHLAETKGDAALRDTANDFRAAAERFRDNLLRHAKNDEGYFNALFNDAGHWVFSPNDPDGRARIGGPANSFAVIAGVATGETRETVFDALNRLKGPYGWRLFHPPIGDPPIAKLGRLGQGDLAAGIYENGAPYNHGSHGFLSRAAWVAGQGNLLYEVFRYMFPYDQEAHPVEVAQTTPYGVVNMWKEGMGMEGIGGMPFLSGTISTAIRNCYQGLIGFRPGLDELVIDPCLPADWEGASAEITFLGGRYRIRINNTEHVQSGVTALTLNGVPIGATRFDARCDRQLWYIPITALTPGKDCVIEVCLGA